MGWDVGANHWGTCSCSEGSQGLFKPMSKPNAGMLQSPSSTAHVAHSCPVTLRLPLALAGVLVRLCRGQDWANSLCENQPAVKKQF